MKEAVSRALRPFAGYAAILAFLFLGLPAAGLLVIQQILVYTLVIINPAVCFAVYFVYGRRSAQSWLAPLWSGILFLPTVFVFYNYTALSYTLAYIVLAYIAQAAGLASRKEYSRKKKSP